MNTDEGSVLAPFRAGLFEVNDGGEGDLIGSRCERCRITFFPPRAQCTECFSGDAMSQVPLGRRGVLYTYTTVYQSKPGVATPYSIGFVDLPEGVRVFARLVECDPESLRTGMEMELTFGRLQEPPGEGGPLVYKFRPVRQAG